MDYREHQTETRHEQTPNTGKAQMTADVDQNPGMNSDGRCREGKE